MPSVVMTPFGKPVEPDVKSNLATVFAPMPLVATSTAAPAVVVSRSRNAVAGRPASPLTTITSVDGGDAGA
jgi:hypothetical protein